MADGTGAGRQFPGGGPLLPADGVGFTLLSIAARVAAGPPDERITLSPTPIESVREVRQDDGGLKPSGLWYDINDSWYRGKKYDGYLEYRGYKHAYRLTVDRSRMAVLDSSEAVAKFDAKYGVRGSYGTEVNWAAVQGDGFSGIEVRPYKSELGTRLPWYGTFDVSSGCVWSPDAVTGMEEIPYGDIGGARRDMTSKLRDLANHVKGASPKRVNEVAKTLEKEYVRGWSSDYGSFEDWPTEVLQEFKESAASILAEAGADVSGVL